MGKPILERLRSLLYPLLEQNDVSDALLYGPSEVLGHFEGALDLLANDGRHVEPGTVTIAPGLTTLTQVASIDRVTSDGLVVENAFVDWNTRFRPGDDIILGGSSQGNNLRRVVATVAGNGQSLTVTQPFVAAETGLLYGKTTYALLRRCQELLLFPGGYETDAELRSEVLGRWIEIMQLRGSRGGVVDEMNRITNAETMLFESVPSLEQLATSIVYTQSSLSLDGTTWASKVDVGDPIAVTGSSYDSNGRYTIYSVSGTTVKVGHRASRSQEYPVVTVDNAVELQFKESRQLNQVLVRLVNTTGASATVSFTLTATGATYLNAFKLSGTATASTTSTVATVSLTAAADGVSEVALRLSSVSPTSAFQLAVTSGLPTQVKLGEMGLSLTAATGGPTLSALWPWRWGGIVATGLRSGRNESGLVIWYKTKPGWYLGVSSPGIVEEDAYTMASPDEFVVLEVGHQNYTNYSERALKTLVREILLPADVDGVLGLL